jgi:PAS domain S-box-containing protein
MLGMHPKVALSKDISDREQIEEALRQSDTKFRTLTETAASAIFIYQGDEFRYANPAAEHLTGYTSGEICKMSFWDIAHPDFHELIRKRGLARQHTKPVPVRYEFIIITKSGEERWVDYTGGTIEFGGEPAILGTAFDITERKKTEQALQASEENYRTLVENIPIGVYRNTPGPQGKYLMVNRAFLNMFGYESEQQIKQLAVADLYVDKSQREIFSDNLLAQESVTGVELHLRRKDGTSLWGSVTARVVRDANSGEVAYFDCSIEDITERKKAEEALREHAQELARLHTISLDISASAHTLDDLLNVIVARSAHLLEAPGATLYLCDPESDEIKLVAESYPVQRDCLGAVLEVGESLARTVAQSGEALLLEDFRSWNGRTPAFEEEPPFNTLASVPLTWQSQIIGVLQVWDGSHTSGFKLPDLELLTLFANQAAVAIANARLREAERAQLLLARTLQEVGALLTSQLGLDEVLENILDLLGRVVQYDSVSIQLVGEDGLLELSAGRGFPDFERVRATVRELSSRILSENWLDLKLAVIPDTSKQPDWIVAPGFEYIRSWIGAALLVKGRLIGILSVDCRTENALNQASGKTVLAFANQAAIAIENARLFEIEEKRVVQLESLRQASLSLTSSLDLEAVFDSILESALNLLPGAQVGHIFLYHPGGGGYLTFGAALWIDGRRGQPVAMPRPDGLTNRVVKSGKLISVPDMRADPLYTSAPAEWSGSIVGLPLKIGQRVVGVMNIASANIGAFAEADLSLVHLLSDQAAIAIENARLFEQAATERRHLGLLYDVSKELAFSLDPDEILDRATTLTCRALNGLSGEAFLYQPEESDRLRLRAVSGRGQQDIQTLNRKLDLRSGVGLAGWVCHHRKPACVGDVSQDPRWKHVPGTDEDVRSALVAPILQGERLLGVLTVLHHRRNAFTDDHLELLQAICHQVGLALSNADRYQQVQSLVDLLAAEQSRLESLMEHLPAGVLLLDADYHLVVANSTGREILALFGSGGGEQAISRLGPYSIDHLTRLPGSPLPVEITLEGPPQKVFEVEARPLGDERPQWVITVREVTQERENQARTQMQERLATVGQLAAGIAHDFNNIMSAIMVYTDLLRRDMDLLPGGGERVVIIQKQVQRASSLIRQILDFSRRSVMEQSTLDMLPFIKEMDKLLERLLPETIQFELNYQPGTYLVKGDPTRLQQVFMNLALNARDAMPEGGTLSFAISRLGLAPEESPPFPDLEAGEWIRLGVSDTGIGISSDALPHIFEPFYSTKAYGEGTGLGLAQAYGIIKQHGGHIDVHSRLGEGSSFIIYLPALPVPTSESESSDEYPGVLGQEEMILLVEDDRVTREALEAMLEAQNYRVLVASNGREALKIYQQRGESIDLVVSDVVMPEMGGVDLYRTLCERWPQLKMLLITGHPLRDEDQALLEGGSVHWLQKPFSVPDFSLLIKELINEK